MKTEDKAVLGSIDRRNPAHKVDRVVGNKKMRISISRE
jgi:hypothetical protein